MQTTASPRNPFIAAAMSLILPGFGQLYNGEVNRAIWLFIGFALLTGPGIVAAALHMPAVLVLPLLAINLGVALGLWIWGLFDAWRGARGLADYVPAGWQMSGVYALVLLACDFVIVPSMTLYLRDHQVESFNIAGASMEPGLLLHDIVFADKRYNCRNCAASVKRGEVAVFTYPNDRVMTYVKRIIALPGDEVRIKGTDVEVNGHSLKSGETAAGNAILVTESLEGRQWQARWPVQIQPQPELSLTVPPGHVFVLGDNRMESKDSRAFGTVPLSDVAGRVQQVWFSYGDDGIRWGRLGATVQ
jgi:signal peptidase I